MICRIRLLLTALAASAGGVAGFAVPASGTIPSPRLAGSGSRLAVMPSWDNVGSWSFDPLYLSSESPSPSPLDGIVENGHEHDRRSSAAIVAAASLLLTSSPAWADSPDWGLFEGRTGSLLHPVAMISMFALSASTALLGFQWKRQRILGDEISALKKTMPDLGGAGSVGEALGTAEGAEVVDALYVRSLRGAMETEANVAELTRERKELANAGPRDKHFNQGALLLFVGTAFAIEGPLNTYALAGNLFPGPHLYAGAALVVVWSLAAGMVPYMQKGSDAARAVHVGANLAGIGLFAWQVATGVHILFMVLELTKWP